MPLKIFKTAFFLLFFLLAGKNSINAQSNPDDYWLNHGFTSGQTVTTNSGKFYDDGGFDKYHANQNWTVRFCSENGNPITLEFNGFRTNYQGGPYSNWDYMTISYPGENLVAYDFDTPQFSFTSPDGCITFGLRTQPLSPLDSGWVAEISANPPPVNNDPCNASELVVGNICSPQFFSNKGAYNTTTWGSPPCHTFFGGGIWFKTTVPSSGQIKIQSIPGTLKYAIMEIFSSTDCSNLARITCVDNVNSMPSGILTGRTPGEEIYIRMFGDQAKSGIFGMCVTDPTSPITGFTGPGGVGDSLSNELWLRSDTGLLNTSDLPAVNSENIKTWKDLSGNQNNLIQNTAGSRPILNSAGLNSLPTVVFDGTDDRFVKELGNISSPVMLFTINNFSSNSNQSLLALGDANNNNTLSISRDASQNYYSFTGSARSGPSLSLNSTYLLQAYHASSSPYHRLKLGVTSQTVTDYASAISTDGSFYLGSNRLGAEFFNGRVSEVIMYSKILNSAQELIVSNYLAAKYSYNIGGSDIYSWDGTHKNDVAGIGRVNALNLHTKAQSAGILAIAGANDLENNEFLLFGHDGGSISGWTSVNVPSADVNILRLERTWRVDQTGGDGSVGEVSISLDSTLLPPSTAGFPSYNIFVDADGDFSNGATAYGTIFTGTEYVANDVSLNDGNFIMIGIVKPFVNFDLPSSSGFESVANPSISVSLNYAISDLVEVSYSISGGTASGTGTDYSLNPGKVIFNPGQKTGVIQPAIIDDNSAEIPDEYFDITLSAPTAGVQLGTQISHRYTILNNDVGISISATNTTIGSCAGSTSTLTANATGSGPFTYLWSPSAGLSSPGASVTNAKPVSSTVYKLTVTDTNGFSNIDSVAITVVPALAKPVITVTGSLTFCSGDSVLLTSTSAASYLWSNSATSQSIYAKIAGNYNVIAYDIYGCPSPASDNSVVIITPAVGTPVFTIGATSTRCQGAGPVTYTATATNSTGMTYTLDAASLTGGNSIVAATGVVTYVAGWNGTSTIAASAAGCNGPGSATHVVTITPTVGTPVFSLGATSTRCQGAGPVTYTATATNSTGMTYTLDAASLTGGNSIAAATGVVTYVAGWNGTSTITASAAGCNGPGSATHVVTITPTVGTPVFSLGATSTRCQGAGPVTYTATATNSTGMTYTLDAASLTGGNSIAAATGVVTYVAGWNGTSTITASAAGCNGPGSATHIVTITPTVGTPVFSLGATSTRCQGAGPVTYTATATNSTGMTYSLDAASLTGGNSIVTATGVVSYVAGWNGTSTITASAAGCNGPVLATHVVTITPTVGTPVFTLGATSTRCQGAGAVTYTATATNSTGLTYTLDAASLAGGNSIVAATGVVTYVAGWNGTSTITASASGCNGPGSVTHVVTITPTVGTPVFTLGATSTRCQGADPVTYTATATNSTGMTYTLDAASLTGGNSIVAATGVVTYVAGWNGTSTITANAAGCNGPGSATHVVTITPTVGTPVFTLGATSTRCQGAGPVTYTATATNSTGMTYTLDAASLAGGNSIVAATGVVTYVAGWNGTSTITANAAGCNGPGSATHVVTITPTVGTPVFTLGATSTRCQGAGPVTYTATATNSTGMTYTLDAASLTGGNSIVAATGVVTYVAGWNGTSTITASASGCNGPGSATHVATVTTEVSAPLFLIGLTSSRCQGTELVSYTATATNSSGITYNLDAASIIGGNTIVAATGDVTYAADWSGTTIITASAAGCNGPKTSDHTITITPSAGTPVFTLGTTSTRCQGAMSVTYTASSTNSTGITYSLDAASVTGGNSIIAATGEVTYVAGWNGSSTITADAAGCSGSATSTHLVTVSAPAKPIITVNGNTAICDGESVSLSAPLAADYLWSTGETTQTIDASVADVYTVRVTDDFNCLSPVSDGVSISVNPLPAIPIVTIIGSTEFCPGYNVNLTATLSDSYLWSNGETSQTITASLTGNYSVQVIDGNSCKSQSSEDVVVTVYSSPEKPVISADGPLTFLIGGSVTLTSSAANSYIWSPGGEITRDILVTTSGLYSVIVTDSHACTSVPSDVAEVIVKTSLDKPNISISGDTKLCEGETVVLTSEDAFSYKWSTGETTQSITVNTAGIYTLIISNSNGIESEISDPVNVSLNQNPQISIDKADVSCFGGSDGSASVVIISGSGTITYLWSNNTTQQTAGNLSAATYSVKATDDNSCEANTSVIILQPDKIDITETITKASCPDAANGRIDLSTTGGAGAYTFNWGAASGSNSSSLIGLEFGSYPVSVTDANNCIVDENYELAYEREECFDVPGIITPNGDSYNDTWIIDGLELYPGNTVEIFNRYGKRVFFMKTYDNSWNGTYNGEELPMESYHYVINLNNGTSSLIGNITIVR